MKLSGKAISSPARTDKFPPPLMRFLRSNAGSRSRRSRSSPMFVLRKKNTTTNTAIETQEPSSPKVTCMGQVRARRSSKSKSKSKQSAAKTKRDNNRAPTLTPCRCWWIPKPNNPCHCRCRPVWPKWPFFRRKPTKLNEDSVKSESNFQNRSYQDDEEETESVCQEERVSNSDNNAFASASSASNSCTPPRNALLLTRCRSAPYRSSSLASRFWGETETETETESESTSAEKDKPTSQSQRQSTSDRESKRDDDDQPKLGFFSSIGSITNSENVQELLKGKKEVIEGDSAAAAAPRPLVLTRCKSEPARTGHRLDPEVNNLWKKRRLSFAHTCSPPLHLVSD